MIRIAISSGLAALVALGGCAGTGQNTGTQRFSQDAPPGAPPDTCWHKDITPAVIETVTEQLIVRPEKLGEDGQVLRPATYKTVTRQQIVEERQLTWSELLCPEALTPDLVSSLQRALAARGVYTGPVTGLVDEPTRLAIRRYQSETGPDTNALTLRSARDLGLVAIPRDPA